MVTVRTLNKIVKEEFLSVTAQCYVSRDALGNEVAHDNGVGCLVEPGLWLLCEVIKKLGEAGGIVKGILPCCQLVEYHANTPNVRREGVVVSRAPLWGHVCHCSHERLGHRERAV